VHWYQSFSKAYYWTPEEIDNQDLDILLDYVVVSYKVAESKDFAHIDEVMQ